MNHLVTYWFIGALVAGFGLASEYNRCGSLEPMGLTALTVAALWPAVISFGITIKHPVPPACPR